MKREIAVALAMMLGLCGCKEAKTKDAVTATDAQGNIIKAALPAGDTPGIPEGTRVKVDEKNFPDEKFRNYISENIDTDHDGELDASELYATRRIDVSHRVILDLKGIEHFTELEVLNCSGNLLDELDLSKNENLLELYCLHNLDMKALDLSHNSKLRVLCCNSAYGGKNIWREDEEFYWVSEDSEYWIHYYLGTTVDEKYWMQPNPMIIKKVSVSPMRVVRGNLKILDVTHCPELEYLDCGNNQLTRLDVSNNPELKYLDCSVNELTTLATAWNPELQYLDCRYNQLIHLDISYNPNLIYLKCGNNDMESLTADNDPGLETLDCADNRLESLNLSGCSGLKNLRCTNNELTTVDVSHSPNLMYLICPSNSLSALNIRNNPSLKYLDCSVNVLEELDVSACPDLSMLICYHNLIQDLDLSRNPDLYQVLSDMKDDAEDVNSDRETQEPSTIPYVFIVY